MQSISYDHVHLRITYGILVDTPMVMFSHWRGSNHTSAALSSLSIGQ